MPVDQEGNDYPHSIAAHKDQPEVLDLQVAVKPRPRPVLCTVQKYILSCVCCLPGNTQYLVILAKIDGEINFSAIFFAT